MDSLQALEFEHAVEDHECQKCDQEAIEGFLGGKIGGAVGDIGDDDRRENDNVEHPVGRSRHDVAQGPESRKLVEHEWQDGGGRDEFGGAKTEVDGVQSLAVQQGAVCQLVE